MKIIIRDIQLPIRHKPQDAIHAAQKIVRHACLQAKDFQIYKQSLDARRKGALRFLYQVTATLIDGTLPSGGQIAPFEEAAVLQIPIAVPGARRPVIVGMGPCGLFAAYVLAKAGLAPIILERGADVDTRTQTVERFWKGGKLDPESNVQFGEGGAGTFSDGKLHTRIHDPRQRFILQTFVAHGAPEDILYKAKPHIGTDALKNVVRSMRRRIIELGGEVRFGSRLTGIRGTAGRLCEIEVGASEAISCDTLVLAIGHSSRDTYQLLYESGIAVEAKPFAVGLRIEHTQRFINQAQYGTDDTALPSADYRLVYNGRERSCYSFCMCPGGVVVNAASEDGGLVVNGMSNHARDGQNANSALVVTVQPSDFPTHLPLAGVAFQRKYEQLAFQLGGGDYTAPVQLARDFAANRESDQLCSVHPTFTGNIRLAALHQSLPHFVVSGLQEGLEAFEQKIHGFTSGDAVLTGVETRTSAPVRIVRDHETLQSLSLCGLYPAGEGAGYAGGIMSAAVDGIRIAQKILENELTKLES